MIGYDIFEAYNIKWRMLHGTIIPFSLPDKKNIISNDQAKKILQKKRAFLIRWETDFDYNVNTDWWHIVKRSNAMIEDVSQKTRNQIKRGIKNYIVTRCDRINIIKDGYDVYVSAKERYADSEEFLKKQSFVRKINKMPENIEFWCVYERLTGRMIGFSENIIDGKFCFYSTIWINPEALKKYASYALFFEMNKTYLIERGFEYVSDGAKSIKHITNIQDFLQEKFGFEKYYAKLNIVYHPSIHALVYCLYPIRIRLKNLSSSYFQKINILLEQERIRRACLNIQ